MPVSLEEILGSTRRGLDAVRAQRPGLEREAEAKPAPPSFREALRKGTVAVIAEVKRRSPSAGPIREGLDPADCAVLYARHGAAAISVLTDGPYFGGSVADLRAATRRSPVPVLRKDFILDEVQILEARAAGAAAVLLIMRALGPRLRSLLRFAADLGLDALVEIHTPEELFSALDADAAIIGVNSRDLDSFRIDMEAAWRIVAQVPADRIVVAESGMSVRRDVIRAAEAGADAVLIGTALSAAAAPDEVLADLTKVLRRGR